MTPILLPRSLNPSAPDSLSGVRQISIVGANGAGKSRFMEEMETLCDDRAYCLNAVQAFYPEREESMQPGSIDALYRDAVRQQPYMRTDAVSELDKLVYMVFADEIESLFSIKESADPERRKVTLKATKLDTIRQVWEKVFPGMRISLHKGHLVFATLAGGDLITVQKLSQGEKAALYYIGAVLYAPADAVIFVDTPSIFVHPAILSSLWNSIEDIRPDCTFVYNSVDIDFINSRSDSACIWVKGFDKERRAWDYSLIEGRELDSDILLQLTGSRRPVLFIEGDSMHSIDMKLYSNVFPDRIVKPLGSCNKVIEATRSLNDLSSLHHLQSYGVVDRDRRTDQEVEYLRKKQILVPDVAEVENIFLLPDVVKVMAERRGRDAAKIMRRLEKDVVRMFKREAEQQALQHVRHKVKRDVECRIDARFTCITALELHLRQLESKLQPRRYYNVIREQFAVMARDSDYAGILRVFNHKPMLPDSGLHQMLGFKSKEDYIAGVISALKGNGKDATRLRATIRHCLHADNLGSEIAAENEAGRTAGTDRKVAQQRQPETRRIADIINAAEADSLAEFGHPADNGRKADDRRSDDRRSDDRRPDDRRATDGDDHPYSHHQHGKPRHPNSRRRKNARKRRNGGYDR